MAQRNTWQRERVRAALGDAPGFISAQSLHAVLRDEDTGIGLATVRRVVDAHGGTIGIEETPGGGTTVWFELPSREQ